ncbi:acetyltransferase (GNAT) family protein [Brevibacillus sp. AG162]|uniref:GNAT family N-acetyltransferase n=1 Tax=Brevibacillus sp. AG162 TaxID=2572910 RepID=UPI00114DBE86|nr:GNAT family N-acetyltransferase [Brevibacillus sp. AG162]TQK73498.1 acetyltransferase (GNAT) family protein [Brevibacillus sp. AG162]
MITVRRIHSEDLPVFLAFPDHPASVRDDIAAYLNKMFTQGAMRQDWCFVLEVHGKIAGRLAFWTLPGSKQATDLVLWELPWKETECPSLGAHFLREVFTLMAGNLSEKIGYVLDSPSCSPQWQTDHQERRNVLEALGFRISRETNRFEWHAPMEAAALLSNETHDQIVYRSLPEVGEAAFVDAILRVSQFTHDQQITEERLEKGPLTQAQEMFQDLQQMKYEPEWWQLAYTEKNELIGFLMPTVSPTFATIGYIGVLPEQRGHGYIDRLLKQATDVLVQAGETYIRADTDVKNTPMAKAFLRAGYQQFANRQEFSLDHGLLL